MVRPVVSRVTVISASRQERLSQFLWDLWLYRELFFTFVIRDLKVRYKQTALGIIWVILQPLLMSGAFSLIFGKIARMPTDGLPYALFYLGALVPWNTFAHALAQSALSMEANSQLISKVYFPRVVVPGAIACASLVDFCIGFAVLNALAALFGCWTWQLLAVSPVLLVAQYTFALGLGLVLAILNAQYRDVKHTVGFLVQVLMLATPVVYPVSRLPDVIRDWIFLNPMAVVVASYRTALKGMPVNVFLIILALLSAAVYLVAGLYFFKKREQRLVDIL